MVERVNRLQNGESDVELVADQSKIFGEPVDGGIANVDPVQECKEVHQTEDGNDPYIDPPHQRRLIDVWVPLLGSEFSIA